MNPVVPVGSHSVHRMFDVGTADEPSCSAALPLLTPPAGRRAFDHSLETDFGRWGAQPLPAG
jgi:hypothetical protein